MTEDLDSLIGTKVRTCYFRNPVQVVGVTHVVVRDKVYDLIVKDEDDLDILISSRDVLIELY